MGHHEELVMWSEILEPVVHARYLLEICNEGAIIHAPEVEVKMALLFDAVD